MTESDWLTGADYRLMWHWLINSSDPAQRALASPRKRRLFQCAGCRRWWHLLPDARSRRAVEVSERYADGLATEEELQAAAQDAQEVRRGCPPYALWSAATAAYVAAREDCLWWADSGYTVCAAGYLVQDAMRGEPWPTIVAARRDAEERERRRHSDLFREVFGNPFRPVPVDEAWRTAAVLALARAAYPERPGLDGTLDPARLAVLADVLEEIGVTDESLLGHLRSPGPHVRGCWALDAVLGQS